MKKPRETLTFEIDRTQHRMLEAISKRTGIPVEVLLVHALIRYGEKMCPASAVAEEPERVVTTKARLGPLTVKSRYRLADKIQRMPTHFALHLRHLRINPTEWIQLRTLPSKP